ncbi:Mitochondrial carrier domain-containing protein [Cynara cardunculus var. scolymus]|uniref:Mitochondrial carrier domain-containing protein n=1 Tax=Cynara cardunculus var. scolymus TaxID=59895 RepID=A0A103YBF1_CYNCS|nr:Mitochondrial carrier domain-containing protein [Cynara cardunculus var. scolymus]
MDFWPEFLASSWGKEFVAGGFGGIAGIMAGYPLDSVRVRQQSSPSGSAFTILKNVAATEGPFALYRGMAAPLASVTFQNAMVFQIYAILSRGFDSSSSSTEPPSYKGVALGGVGAGAIQSLMLSPIELIKIRLQLQTRVQHDHIERGPLSVAKNILRTEGWRGLYRGLTITALRDAPSHGFYFWTYEFMREKLHPGCRTSGQESFNTMLVAGGLAGVASWVCCYPLDVVKTRLQAQTPTSTVKYNGIVDCLRKSVQKDGYSVLWRGLGTAVSRAFVVNGAIFTAYETALRVFNRVQEIRSEISKDSKQ